MNGWRGWLVLVTAAGTLAGLVGGATGVGVGMAAMTAGAVVLRRAESPTVRRERARAVADLPLAADLFAAAARAGAPPERAARVVGNALGGPVGGRLVRVADALRLGDEPGDAWSHLADLPGGARLARAAARSAERGTALTRVFENHAEELRKARAAHAEASARRAGVLVVLPLGLCFLPAFLLAGVVPVVTSVLGDVLGG
jgi:pilus assembly protein TadC